MIETTSDYFDQVPTPFDVARRAFSPELADMLEGFGFLPGKKILDVGCGTGPATSLMLERGCLVTGLDGSEKMLEATKARIPGATYVLGKAEELPFAPRSFDGVVSGQTFHHVEQDKALRETIRVTKPGGRVALFWKLYSYEEPVREVRETAFREFGVEPPREPLTAGFPLSTARRLPSTRSASCR